MDWEVVLEDGSGLDLRLGLVLEDEVVEVLELFEPVWISTAMRQ